VNAVPFTVIGETAILDVLQVTCYWQVNAGACPSASVTVYNSADVDGTTYGENNPPFTFFMYPGYWTVPFEFYTVGVVVSESYHTASIVEIPLNYEC
jgi:hypothetical protein